VIDYAVQVLGLGYSSNHKSFSFIAFESKSILQRIEFKTFSRFSIKSNEVAKRIDILGFECFSHCGSFWANQWHSPVA
jgi:hypothetical protein